MVSVQLARRGISDRRVLNAMRAVRRENFVEPGYAEFAYEDHPLPIGEGQTISQPYIVAFMLEAAEIAPGDHVLEVGAGSGYAAAVISRMAERVHAIEWHPSLAAAARRRVQELGYDNLGIVTGDGTRGLPDAAPFDVIIVSAGGPAVPVALKEQLALDGRMIVPVEADGHQNLQRITRRSQTDYECETVAAVAFVPLSAAWEQPEQDIKSVTVMFKREEGYAPKSKNWVRVKYNPNGSSGNRVGDLKD